MSAPHLQRRTFIGASAAGLAAAGGLSACAGSSKSNEASGSSDGTLTLAATSQPVSMNPILQNVDPVNNWYINLAYDSLIRLDGKGELVPDLATEWTYAKKNTELTLKIRKGVTFSDGEPLNADAVAKSIDYARTKGVNANWLSTISKVTAKGDDTVVVKTSQPNDSLPFLFSQRLLVGSVISPKAVADPDLLKTESHGAGPYVLDTEQTVANSSYVFTPNDSYWDKSKIHWKKVIIKVVSNTTAALQGLQSGEIDIFRGDAATARAAKAKGLSVSSAYFAIFGLNYGDREGKVVPALKDVRVRQALSYAIDRKAIAKAVFGEFAVASNTLTVEGFPGYAKGDVDSYAYNMQKAKQLLREAGYAKGFSLELASTKDLNTDVMSQAVVEGWKELGVKAKLTSYSDNGQLVTDILAKKYPVTAYSYGCLPQYIQAQSFFIGGANQYNPWNTEDKKINATLDKAARAADTGEQDQYYQRALHRAMVDLVWASNVFDTPSLTIYDPKKIKGVETTPTNPTPDVGWSVAPM